MSDWASLASNPPPADLGPVTCSLPGLSLRIKKIVRIVNKMGKEDPYMLS